jgi:hypothetical protein
MEYLNENSMNNQQFFMEVQASQEQTQEQYGTGSSGASGIGHTQRHRGIMQSYYEEQKQSSQDQDTEESRGRNTNIEAGSRRGNRQLN